MRWLIGSLATLAAAVVMDTVLDTASVAQDNPPGPAFGSTYRYQFSPNFGHSVRFCASQLASPPSNRPAHSLVLNLLSNPFLPPLNTPVQQFQAPPGWTWQPDSAGNAWRVSSPTPMPLNQEQCFSLPVSRRFGLGELLIIVTEAFNREDIYYFTSQQVVPKEKPGDLRLVYTLPQQDVTATFASPSSACGLARNFTTSLRISATNNLGTIVEPRTGDTVKGTVNPKTYTFKFTGLTEVYEGGIKGREFRASYAYTRTVGGQPCTAGYVALIDLSKPATIAPACKQPTIVAPRTVFIQSGPFRIRIGATCAGRPVAGIKGTATIRFGSDVRRMGPFVTRPTPEPMQFRRLTPAELQRMRSGRAVLELRTPRQRGLGQARRGYVCGPSRVCR